MWENHECASDFWHEGLGSDVITAECRDPKAKLALAPGGVTAVEKEPGCPAEGMDQAPGTAGEAQVSSLLQTHGLGSLPSPVGAAQSWNL